MNPLVFLQAVPQPPPTLPSPSPSAPALGGGIVGASFLLSVLIWGPVVWALAMAFAPTPRRPGRLWQLLALWAQLAVALLTLIGYIQFASPTTAIQFEEKVPWMPGLGISYHLGVDGIGITMLLLNSLIMVAANLASSGIREREKHYFVLLLLVQSAVVGAVSARDLFLLLTFMAALLVPAGLLVLGWGGPGRVAASRRYVAYAGAGVAALAAAFLLLYAASGGVSFDFDVVFKAQPSPRLQVVAGTLVVLGAACWLPLLPAHGWVRSVLAEAPTGVAVAIAGLLSRLGGYILVRVLVGGLHDGARLLAPMIAILAALTVIYAGLAAMRRDDVRRSAAYLAMVPGGVLALGVSGLTPLSLNGAVFGLLAGGAAAALIVGACATLAEHAQSRRLALLGGLFGRMPALGWLLVFGGLAVLGLPLFGTFISNVMSLMGSFRTQPAGAFGTALGLIATAVAMAWLISKVLLSAPVEDAPGASEASLGEKWYLGLLVGVLLWIGILPGGPRPGGVPIFFDPGLAIVVNASTTDLASPYVPPAPAEAAPGGGTTPPEPAPSPPAGGATGP